MTRRIEIDPVTRIEGHLRVVLELGDAPGGGYIVTEAHNTATLFRGFEIFMRGRDPRDCPQMAQRICGVCPTPHAFNSVRAIENALGMEKVPNNARLVRNMMEAAQIGYDHILWFYQLNALDYVDVAAAATQSNPTLPTLVNLKKTLADALASGRPGPFAGGWWGHPAYKLPPDLGLELLQHYLEALRIEADANKAAAAIGGKYPMIMNYAPGGLTHLPDISALQDYRTLMERVSAFVDQVMIPDLLAMAPYCAADLIGVGRGRANYMTWGVLDTDSQDPYDRVFPRGAIFAGTHKLYRCDPTQVRIFTGRSFYDDEVGRGKHPLDAGQEPVRFTGLDDLDGKYDWTQAARLGRGNKNHPMEVGPLAQILVGYLKGRKDIVKLTDSVMGRISQAGVAPGRVAGPSVGPAHRHGPPIAAPDTLDVLMSTFGRIVARVLKAKISTDRASMWADQLLESVISFDREYFAPKPMPDVAEGAGGWDAPRGALCHWIRIQGGKVGAYAAVPPSNWNLSPRDDDGMRGPVEEALVGTRVIDPQRPLEVLRLLHSFDP